MSQNRMTGFRSLPADDHETKETPLSDMMREREIRAKIREEQTARKADRSQNIIQPWGYSVWELDKAFELVSDPNDWKGPIDSEIHVSLVHIVMIAIEFMTATKPVFSLVDSNTGRVRVTSEGYRNGPAGQ